MGGASCARPRGSCRQPRRFRSPSPCPEGAPTASWAPRPSPSFRDARAGLRRRERRASITVPAPGDSAEGPIIRRGSPQAASPSGSRAGPCRHRRPRRNGDVGAAVAAAPGCRTRCRESRCEDASGMMDGGGCQREDAIGMMDRACCPCRRDGRVSAGRRRSRSRSRWQPHPMAAGDLPREAGARRRRVPSCRRGWARWTGTGHPGPRLSALTLMDGDQAGHPAHGIAAGDPGPVDWMPMGLRCRWGDPMPMGGSALNSVLRSRVISVSCMRAPESPREGRCRGVMIGGRWRVALAVGSPPGRRPLLSRRGVVRSAGASGRAPRAVLRGRGAVLGRSTLFPVTGPGTSPCPMT